MKTPPTPSPAPTPDDDNIDMDALERKLDLLPSDQVYAEFTSSYGRAAYFIACGAVCVKILEKRGEKLSGIPQIRLFRRVACGQVLPQMVWKFFESPGRSEIERAPLEDQRRLAENPVRPVVEPVAGGGYTTRMVDTTKAPLAVVRQVLGPDGLRSPEEQIAFLSTSRPRPAARPPAAPAETPDEPLDHSLTVRLTASELAALRVNAAHARVSDREMARRGLLKSGYLKEGKAG